jgi:uncharacterized coiled-coil protein SlyX
MTEIESRVIDLELRFMKLELFTQELSDVVAEQRRTIEALTLETRRLRERQRAEEEQAHGETGEIPPHY